jgi:hypothetical protein
VEEAGVFSRNDFGNGSLICGHHESGAAAASDQEGDRKLRPRRKSCDLFWELRLCAELWAGFLETGRI